MVLTHADTGFWNGKCMELDLVIKLGRSMRRRADLPRSGETDGRRGEVWMLNHRVTG